MGWQTAEAGPLFHERAVVGPTGTHCTLCAPAMTGVEAEALKYRPVARVRSSDGTPIEYEREGDGPAVILVGGGLDDGSENAPRPGAGAAGFHRMQLRPARPGGERRSPELGHVARPRGTGPHAGVRRRLHGDGPPPVERLARIIHPALVLTGESGEFFSDSADAIAASMPNAERLVLEGRSHIPAPAAIAPALQRFFRP